MSKTLSTKCYQENKEKLKKKASEKYSNLPNIEKEKKQECGHECYKNV